MRKKIAVFTSGWGGENLKEVVNGIVDISLVFDTDVFVFVNFSTHSNNPSANTSEIDFYKLPNIMDFDGVIMLANSFNDSLELEYLHDTVIKNNIPSISIEYEQEGIPCITTDNYKGMHDLAVHLIAEHEIRDIVFIGGPESHPECQIRLNALLDVATENNIIIPPESIIYSDWGKVEIPDIVDNAISARNGKLPDAFICANDIMALAVCDRLRTLGKKVPHDVIVTGYDNISSARTYTPSITSVSHEWRIMGQKSFANLLKLINNEPIYNKVTLDTRFVIGSSCGCTKYHTPETLGEIQGWSSYISLLDSVQVDSHFRHFYSAVKNADTSAKLHDSFSYLFSHDYNIEGKDYSLFLNPDFFEVSENGGILGRTFNREKYFCACDLKDGVPNPASEYSLHDALFAKSEGSESPACYVFVSLANESQCFGFAQLNGIINVANDNLFYIWSRHMIQSLEQVQSNLKIQGLYKKMQLLSVTDPLTGVYNRAGCESISYPMLIEGAKSGKHGVIMLIDVDKMKTINDQFGHSCGDQALIVVTSVLGETLPKDFIISRFGGDEFFVAGLMDASIESFDTVINNIEANLAKKVEELDIAYKLTISMGAAFVTPSNTSDIEKAIVSADNDMYQRKDLHHQNI